MADRGIEELLLGEPLTLGYRPQLPILALHDVGDVPLPLMLRDVEAMLLHPYVDMCLSQYKAGISGAKWKIRAPSSKVGAWADAMLRRFWEHCLTQTQNGYDYGWGGYENLWTTQGGLLWHDGLIDFSPLDTTVLTIGGRYAGVRVKGTPGAPTDLWGPRGRWPAKAFWFCHRRRYNQWYGRTQLYAAWRPWRRLAGRDGAEQVVDMGFYRFAYRGPVGRYPPEDKLPPGNTADASRKTARDKMRELVEAAKAGVSVALPSSKYPAEMGGDYKWQLDFPEHTLSVEGLLGYPEYLKGQICYGVGIPPELIEASEVGSGWSGRRIPLVAYFTGQQHNARAIVRAWYVQIALPACRWNFGPKAWFDVELLPLLPPDQQPPGAPGGAPPAGAPAGGGGGGGAWQPTSPGPKGGSREVNTQTGQTRYGALSLVRFGPADDDDILQALLLAMLDAQADGDEDEVEALASLASGDGLEELRAHLAAGRTLATWAPYQGPRGGRGWQDTETGRIIYGANKPGARLERRTGSAEQAGKLLGRALSGEAMTAEHLQALAGHLGGLTVPQLREYRRRLKLTFGGGRRKEQMVEAIRQFAAGTPLQRKKPAVKPRPPGRAGAAGAPWADGSKPDPGAVYNAPPGGLVVDPERFQFKLNVSEKGVTDEMRNVKTWNPDFAGVVSVWQDPADGKTYVINGHHRHELADRLGVNEMAVRYINAGSAKEARAVGALVNIAEGRGTAIDAAKFLRDSGTGIEDLERHGISLKGKVAADAAVLTRLNDRLFDRLARGLVEPGKALAVARHLDNPDLQNQLFRLLDKREEEGKDLPPKVIEEMAREMAETPTTTKTERSLFGDLESEESLFVERNELKSHVRGEMAREVSDFLAVASKRRAERVGKGGKNVLDPAENKRIAEEANRVKNVFDTLVNRKGKISDALNEAAGEYAKAKGKKERDAVRAKTLAAVRDAVFDEAGVGRRGEGAGAAGGGAAAAEPGAGAGAAERGAGDIAAAGLKPEEEEAQSIEEGGERWAMGVVSAVEEGRISKEEALRKLQQAGGSSAELAAQVLRYGREAVLAGETPESSGAKAKPPAGAAQAAAGDIKAHVETLKNLYDTATEGTDEAAYDRKMAAARDAEARLSKLPTSAVAEIAAGLGVRAGGGKGQVVRRIVDRIKERIDRYHRARDFGEGGGVKPVQLATGAHAPTGGVTIQGHHYPGGQFIPGAVLEQASAEERRGVLAGRSRKQRQRDKRASRTQQGEEPTEPDPAAQQAVRKSLLAMLPKGFNAAADLAKRLGRAVSDEAALIWGLSKVIEHRLKAPTEAAQRQVVAHAARHGKSAEHAVRIASLISTADAIASWTVNVPLAHAGLHAVGLEGPAAVAASKLAYYVPVGSLAYLAYGKAADGFDVLKRAAAKLSGRRKATMATRPEPELIDGLLDAFNTADDPELLHAMLALALEQTHGDLAAALRKVEESAGGELSLIRFGPGEPSALALQKLAARIRRVLLRSVRPGMLGSEVLGRLRQVLVRHEAELVRHLADAHLLESVREMRRVVESLPEEAPPPISGASEIPAAPPVEPLGPDTAGQPRLPQIEAAVADLRARVPLSRAAFDRLDAAARERAFTVAGAETEHVVEKVRDVLADVVESGASLRAFRRRLEEEALEGTFLSPWHLETVWRTNAQEALARGQEAILEQPLVGDAFPYAAIEATHDDRVRPAHLALERYGLDGTNVYRRDDPTYIKFRAPWDYNCRCSTIPLTIEQAARRGVREAKAWLETGRPPVAPEHVEPPPFEPPPEFRTARTLAVVIQEGKVISGKGSAPSRQDPRQGAARAAPAVDEWTPYQGGHGGRGWRNSRTGEIRYQQEKPGSRAGQAPAPPAVPQPAAPASTPWQSYGGAGGKRRWINSDTGEIRDTPPPPEAAPSPPSQTREPTPSASPPPSGALQTLHEGINKAEGLTGQQRAYYQQSAARVLGRMPPAAHARIGSGLKEVHFAPSTKEMGVRAFDHLMKLPMTAENRAKLASQRQMVVDGSRVPGGLYNGKLRAVFLDGDSGGRQTGRHGGVARVEARHIYAHELTHVVDGHNHEFSNSPEWQQAFDREIRRAGDRPGRLNNYAATSKHEGFAEFGRLLYAGDVEAAHIERHFPLASKFFRSKGLWVS